MTKKNKWLLALGAAGAFALVSACGGNASKECGKLKTKTTCAKNNKCMWNGTKCVVKPANTNKTTNAQDGIDNQDDQTGNQQSPAPMAGKVCRNKVGIKWEDLAKLTKTTDADKEKECNEKTFGPQKVAAFKWVMSKCELSPTICFLGATTAGDTGASNDSVTYTANAGAFGQLQPEHISIMKSDGTAVAAACTKAGVLHADLVADNPCMKVTTSAADCMAAKVTVSLTTPASGNRPLMLFNTNNNTSGSKVEFKDLTGFCKASGPEKTGCHLQSDKIADFGCASITDEKQCKDDYKDVCELVDLKDMKTIKAATTSGN